MNQTPKTRSTIVTVQTDFADMKPGMLYAKSAHMHLCVDVGESYVESVHSVNITDMLEMGVLHTSDETYNVIADIDVPLPEPTIRTITSMREDVE